MTDILLLLILIALPLLLINAITYPHARKRRSTIRNLSANRPKTRKNGR